MQLLKLSSPRNIEYSPLHANDRLRYKPKGHLQETKMCVIFNPVHRIFFRMSNLADRSDPLLELRLNLENFRTFGTSCY